MQQQLLNTRRKPAKTNGREVIFLPYFKWWNLLSSFIKGGERGKRDMQGGDSPKLKALIETWGGVWRRRRPLHKGKEEDQVGLFLDQSRCLAELLQHYPRIVYLGFTFWRKLLLYLHVRPEREHFEDVALYHPSASVINSHELAIVGNLDKLQLLFPPTSKFFSEKRPITRKTLIEADPGATSKRRVHTITEESLVTQFGFFLHWCILNQQKDVLDLVIGKLQLDLEGHYFSQWTPLMTAARKAIHPLSTSSCPAVLNQTHKSVNRKLHSTGR